MSLCPLALSQDEFVFFAEIFSCSSDLLIPARSTEAVLKLDALMDRVRSEAGNSGTGTR
jgi:hypothetical protein